MKRLQTIFKDIIEQEAIKNLLSAQKRIADEGSAADLIRVTNYLLRLAKKRGDVLIDVVSESNEERSRNPVKEL